MDTITKSLNWFEIPVTDMARSKHFYQVIFSIHKHEMEMVGMKMVGFPGENGSGKVSGALVQSENHITSPEAVVLYLNANPDMNPVLEIIEQEEGHVILPITDISPEIGYVAFFMDTKGNKVALH